VRVLPSIHSVWLLLILFTSCSWGVFEFAPILPSMNSAVVTAVVLLLAFFKARLVILHYMEAATAPVALRMALELWIALAAASLMIQLVAAAMV
jgi:Prokaryotic Cytochrome C oxidase subunit IV